MVAFFIIVLSGVRLSSLDTMATTGLSYQRQMIDDDDDYGAIGSMKIGKGNRSSRINSAPTPLFPPQLPHYQDTASNPGRCDGKPATNRLSYGAAEGSNIKQEWKAWGWFSVAVLIFIEKIRICRMCTEINVVPRI
jgi:hypothetical protein